MADFDIKNDVTPMLPFPSTNAGGKFPTIAALRAAIAGSGVAASYPTATLLASTKNDLVFICRTHGIAVVGI
jgi:hypothetical protein